MDCEERFETQFPSSSVSDDAPSDFEAEEEFSREIISSPASSPPLEISSELSLDVEASELDADFLPPPHQPPPGADTTGGDSGVDKTGVVSGPEITGSLSLQPTTLRLRTRNAGSKALVMVNSEGWRNGTFGSNTSGMVRR